MIPESWTVYLGYDQIDSRRQIKGKGFGNFGCIYFSSFHRLETGVNERWEESGDESD